jgi:hypothetical protein
MLNIFTVVLLLFVFFCSLFEIIVFNEEIFLAVCFVAFTFVCYARFNNFFSSAFQSRSKNFGLGLLFSLYCDFFVFHFNSQENLLFSYLLKIDNDFLLLDINNQASKILNKIFAFDFFISCAGSSFGNFTQYFALEFKTFLVVQENYNLTILYSLPYFVGASRSADLRLFYTRK